jgi:hypothetical protein
MRESENGGREEGKANTRQGWTLWIGSLSDDISQQAYSSTLPQKSSSREMGGELCC